MEDSKFAHLILALAEQTVSIGSAIFILLENGEINNIMREA